MTPYLKSLQLNPPKLRKCKKISIKIAKPGQSFDRSGFRFRRRRSPDHQHGTVWPWGVMSHMMEP